MLWLQTPPWGRWLAAIAIAATATWVEFRPDPLVDHPFAEIPIAAGESLSEANIIYRRIPSGLIEPVPVDGVALRPIKEGEPLLPTSVGPEDRSIPAGWWTIELEVPQGADRGDPARLVLLDTGEVMEAVVVVGLDDDPLGRASGAVAVGPEHAAAVAAAAAAGRVAVMIRTG